MIHTHIHNCTFISVYTACVLIVLCWRSRLSPSFTPSLSLMQDPLSLCRVSLSYYYFEFPKLFSITEYTTLAAVSLSLSIFVICIQISSIISTSHNKSTHKHTLHSFTFIYRQGVVSLAHLSLQLPVQNYQLIWHNYLSVL